MQIVGYVILGLAGAIAGLFSADLLPVLIIAMMAFIGGTLVGAGTALNAIYKQIEEDSE